MTSDARSPLTPREQRVLDRLAANELESGRPTPILHVLLDGEAEDEDLLRGDVAALAMKRCVLLGGFPPNQDVYLTARGLAESSSFSTTTAIAERLLKFFKDRLVSEGARFTRFTWEQLRAAGVADSDEEMPRVAKLITLLDLARGASLVAPGDTWWAAPNDLNLVRGARGIEDLLRRASERADPARVAEALQSSTVKSVSAAQDQEPDKKKIFVIYGRNDIARHEVGVFLRSLKLEPVWFNDVRKGMSATATVAEVVDRGMKLAHGVIAIFTPDEHASLRPQLAQGAEKKSRWQARPNVLFEAGMAFGRNRERVAFVLFGDVELFTDASGILVYRPTNEHGPDSPRTLLRGLLGDGMGCDIDYRTDDWMKAGDFDKITNGLSEVSPRDPFRDQ